MPTLTEFASSKTIKLLNIGESKSGKTGALASLAAAGYNLYILDYDGGLEILANVLRGNDEALSRVRFESPRDAISFLNGTPKVKTADAYKAAGRILVEWNAQDFTSADILVIDTLTTLTDAAFNEALKLAGRLNQRPQLQDYGWMAESVKLLIEMITSPDFGAHVIVNSHIRYFSGSDDDQTLPRGLPNAKGQEISRIVSRYFNSVVLTRTQGSGPGAKRLISTQPQGVVEVATSSPLTVKPSYPVETGLASLFKDILGTEPSLPSTK